MTCKIDEIMKSYPLEKLSKFDEDLIIDYINCNFDDDTFLDNHVDILYKDGCYCNEYDENDYKICKCENDISYYDDDFMLDKIPKFPKNMKFQQYYDTIFPKRQYKNKIFYYLPSYSKYVFTSYFDKTVIETVNIIRNISYFFINEKLVLVEDYIGGWFGEMFKHYHIPSSENFKIYVEKLENMSNVEFRCIKYE